MAYQFTDGNFEKDALKSTMPVVVDFYADWCGPCKMMAPIIDELANEFDGKVRVGKLNTDENRGIAGKYNIMSIPTILFIKDGVVVEQVMGAVPKTVVQEKINKML